MEERRKSVRVHTHLPARWETPAGVYTGIITNGSTGGCFVSAQVEEPGETVRLIIRLPDGKDVHLLGEVGFHLPTKGFGLYFPDPSDEDQAMLDTWLDYIETVSGAEDGSTGSSSATGDVAATAALRP